MKKITLLLLIIFFSISGYSQLALEGFESTTGPTGLPSTTWTLGTGNWAVFDNGIGLGQRWGINSSVTTPPTPPIVYQGTNAAYVNRENIGQGNTSEDYLATPLVTIPTNGQLHFYTRSFTTGNQGTIYQIKVAPANASQTDPGAYTLVTQWTEVDLTTTYNIYEEKVVSLSAYAGQQVYVSFVKIYNQPLTTLDGDRWLVDNVSIIEQCLDPTTLAASGITQTSANLSWGNPSGATSWEIEILPAAGTFTGVGVVYNGILPYNATATATGTAFTPSTDYKYYVRALCSNGGSSLWVGPFLFSTTSPGISCAAPIVIGTLPYSTTDNTSNYSDNTAIEGVPGTSCGAANGYLNGNDVVYAYTATANGVINVTMTPTATYSGIFVYNSCANIGVSCIAGVGNSNTGVRTFDLTVTAGTTYYIVISTWASPQTTGYTLTLQTVNCPPPTILNATGISQNGANISWANPGAATSWEYVVQSAGSAIPTGSGTQTSSNTTNPISGLTSGTNYQFYVRADCGNGTFSAWTGPYLFSTAANYCAGNHFYDTGGATGVYNNSANVTTVICPDTPGDQITVIFNTFNLESGFDYLKIYDGNSATGTTLLGNFTGATLPPSFTSSAVNGCLTFVFTSDTSVTLAGWDATILCLPPPTCPKPTAVNISAIGQNSASIAWTEVGTATTWEVLLLPAGSPAPLASASGITTTDNPYLVNGLTSATSYDVYVRAICSTTDISLWSNKVTFTTLITNDECANAIIVPVNPATFCTFTASGALTGATASTQGNTCFGTDDDDVWFQFTATSTQHIISLLNVAGSTQDLFHVLYTGSCGGLTQLYCSDPNSSTANNLTVGQVYYIRIYSYTSTPNQNSTFNICITTPVPPPTCINNQPAGNTCQTATPICNLNGYCGSTSSTYTADYWSQLNTAFCGSIENNSFLTFVATSTAISFDVWVTSSTDNGGIQIMIFSATNCSGTVNEFTCWSPGIVPSGSTNISANGLVVGNTYYIMIDGFGGDVCDYVIAANSGIQTQVNATTSDDTLCLGDTVNLNAVGGNGSYNWTSSPATTGLSATTGSDITFTPTASGVYTITATSTDGNTLCPQDVSDFVTITVNNDDAPVFDTFGPYCEGETIPALPTTSNNGVTGTWSTALVNNTQSGSYTFTPDTSECSSPVTVSITIDPIINPSFDTIPALCNGETSPILPTLSNNNITGIWNPLIIDNTQSGTYTFTPDAGQCATAVVVNVTVDPLDTPTFLSPAPICSGDTPPVLPLTSLNGITGTWSPSVVDNTQTATYTFTPDADQCATTTTMSVTVYQNCSFGSYASAVWLTNCQTGDFFNTVGSGASIIGPAQNIFPNTDFGTYVSYSNTFKLRGAEVKTFKIATANVCSARLYYRIYPASGTPGTFAVMDLPFLDDCVSGSFPSGGPCNTGDQKWQKVLTDAELPIDLTAYPAGEYILEVYYDVTGDVNSTTQCDDTILINNNGANYIATYTLQANPTFTSITPTTCVANDGEITIGSLAPNTTYSLTYSDDSTTVGPTSITTDNTGAYSITGLNAGTYSNFSFTVNSCSFTSTDVITFNIPSTAPVTGTDPLTCNGNTGTITISNLIPNQTYAVTYTDDTILVGPANFTSDVNGQITLTGLNAGVYTAFNLNTANCTVTSSDTVTLINPGAPVVSVNSTAICNNQTATVTATPQTPGTYNYVWTVPAGFTNPGNVASFVTTVPGTYTVVATPIATQFCNGSFESPTATGQFPNMLNENVVPCWDTTAADGILEVWPAAGFENVFAYQGTQFIEMNGNSIATIFQDFTTSPGSQLQISFAHRGRQGNDTVRVEIGPVGGPYVSLGNFTDGNTAWVLHNLTYTIPAIGGNNYSLRFVSVSSTGGNPSVGNFLDAVTVTSTGCSSLPTSGMVSLSPSTNLVLSSNNNSQNICINTAIANIVYTATNADSVNVTGLPSGVTGTFDSGTGVFTISGTPTQSGIFNYGLSTSNSCNTVALTGTITVNPTITPTFTPISICNGQTVAFPGTSLEGLTGTWNPGNIDNTQSGSYTFTPNSGQCALQGTLTITVNPLVQPTFSPVSPICSGDPLNPLPTNSIEGIVGTWSPALNNTATTTYTFTPNAVNPSPTNLVVNGDFTAGNSGFNTDYQYLVDAGLNGVQKAYGIVAVANTWFQFFPACNSNSPSGGNMMVVDGSTTNGGNDIVWSQTVTVLPNQTYNFSYWLQTVSMPNPAIAEVTINGVSIGMTTAPGNNCESGQYSYTWNSGSSTTAQIAIYDRNIQSNGNDFSLDDISLIQANFIPCPTSTTLTITVNQPVTSTFNAISELCFGGTAPALPTNSLEGFTGTWTPAEIDNTTSGTYTFVPDANQCATNGSLAVTVQSSFDFEITGSCVGNNFILEVAAVNASFDVNAASFAWFTSNQQLVGSNANTFDVSQYLNSTTTVEELPISFNVTVTTPDGCFRNESITLDRIYCDIQKGISADNDGNNDFFDLSLLDVKNLSIYNRYGMKVYSKNQYRDEWRGQSDKGEELPDGTYYYVIEFNNETEAKTGWIYKIGQN